MKYLRKITQKILITCFLFCYTTTYSQVVDQIVAIVGQHIVLTSDIETQYIQFLVQGESGGDALKCDIFEELLVQKLLLQQANIDSIEISESQIESEMDRRLRFFISQIGSQEKLEEYYNKSIAEIKEEFYPFIKEQLLVQQVQSGIIQNVRITPSEVRRFYNSIPEDSLPMVDSEMIIGHIVKHPTISEEVKQETRRRLNAYRDRIIGGEDFSVLAVLYSEDPGSSRRGGELGFYSRGELYPEFEAIAFGLSPGEVSPVIETKAGYHIIQLIERRGERVNVRHILLQPKPSVEDIAKAKEKLDSVYNIIKKGDISFEEAAMKYSDDPSKNNRGIIVNPRTLSSRFTPDELSPSKFFVIDRLEPREISKPVPMRTEGGRQAYRILYLKSRTEPHLANLKDDYDKIQEMALLNKQSETLQKWVERRIENTYINIIDNYLGCDFINKWQ